MLATSRERLNIAGESTLVVPPLALPDEGERAVGQLEGFESVRLFLERARLSDPDFHLTDENASAVVQLCRRLDGLPLAIELAAARVRLLSVDQIVARLNDRFQLLTGGGRTTSARQQTLRAALDWSHDLLSLPERTLLRRLSVFTGGFTLEAVEAICAETGVERPQMLDLLAQLVDKSLVIVETATPFARYRLLETIWEYCRARVIQAGCREAERGDPAGSAGLEADPSGPLTASAPPLLRSIEADARGIAWPRMARRRRLRRRDTEMTP